MNYKKAFASLLITSVLFISSLTGCGAAASADSTGSKADSGAVTKDSGSSSAESPDYGKTADASDMTDVDPVGEDWMTPIGPDGVVNGVYQAAVDSSSSMFKIKDCVLTVSDDSMTARLTMNGTVLLPPDKSLFTSLAICWNLLLRYGPGHAVDATQQCMQRLPERSSVYFTFLIPFLLKHLQ